MRCLALFLSCFTLLFSEPKVIALAEALLDRIIFVEPQIVQNLDIPIGGWSSDIARVQHLFDHPNTILRSGGSGSNIMKGLAALGLQGTLVGPMGTGPLQDFFCRDLAEEKIENKMTLFSPPFGQVICLVTPEGERTFFVDNEPGPLMQKEHLSQEDFIEKELLVIDGYKLLNPSLVQGAAEMAHACGCKVALGLGAAFVAEKQRDFILYLLHSHSIDFLFGNRDEFAALYGNECPLAILENLKHFGVSLILTNGEKGAYVLHEEQHYFQPAFKTKAVDMNGAGDYFVSGFFYGYLTGHSIEKSLHLAALMGSEAVKHIGAYIPRPQIETVRGAWLKL